MCSHPLPDLELIFHKPDKNFIFYTFLIFLQKWVSSPLTDKSDRTRKYWFWAGNSSIEDIEINASLIFLLICRLIKFYMISKKVSKIQPIRVSFAETEQPIWSQKMLRDTNERTLIGRSPAWISKRED